MVHIGILVLRMITLLDGILHCNFDQPEDDILPNNFTINTLDIECFIQTLDNPMEELELPLLKNYSTYGCNYDSGTLQCYYPIMKQFQGIKGMIQKAQNSVLSYAKTENLEDVAAAVELIGQVVKSWTEIVVDIQDFTKKIKAKNESRIFDDKCFSFFLSLKKTKKMMADSTSVHQQMKSAQEKIRIRQHMLSYYLPPVVTFVFIIGLIGNGILLLIFLKHPETRSGPKVMLVSLALSDMMMIWFIGVLQYLMMLHGFPFGEIACYVYNFFICLSCGASVYSVMVLSFTKYLAVTAMPGDRSYRLLNNMPFMVAIVWILASLQTIHGVSNTTFTKYSFTHKIDCDMSTSVLSSITISLTICFLPVTAIASFSFATSRHLRESVQKAVRQTKCDLAKEKHAKIVPAMALVHAITFPPFFILWLVISFIELDDLSSTFIVLYYFTWSLFTLNSALNPVALYLASDMFQGYFDKYLFQVRERKQTPLEASCETDITISQV